MCGTIGTVWKFLSELWVSIWEYIGKLLGFTNEIYVIIRFWVNDMQKLVDDYFLL